MRIDRAVQIYVKHLEIQIIHIIKNNLGKDLQEVLIQLVFE
jgi:hypothetical protein